MERPGRARRSMIVPVFVDTNVLLYANDVANPTKREVAQALIATLTREDSARVSLQVLQEFFAVATRKLKIDPSAAQRHVEVYASFDVVLLDAVDLLGAIGLHRLHGFSIWDALI